MFSNGKWSINVKKVGEAINELKLLPGSMRLDQDYDREGTDIVVMNREDAEGCHVHFAAGHEYDDGQADEAHEDTAA